MAKYYGVRKQDNRIIVKSHGRLLIMRKLKKFTREQVKALAANPYTSKVDFHCIWYTEEFMKLFLDRYKNGDTSFEIFESCGYDIAVLGENRVYGFPRRVMRLLGISQGSAGAAEKLRVSGARGTEHDTTSAGQSVSDMQRELENLRRQVQLLREKAVAEDIKM